MSDNEMNVVEYSVDLNNAEAPPALPAGNYPFEIRTAEVKTSANSGKKYYALGLYIAPESFPADATDLPSDGMVVGYNKLSAQDDVQSRFRVRKFLEAVGGKLSNKVNVNDLIGLTGTVATAVGEWEGVPKTEADKIVAK